MSRKKMLELLKAGNKPIDVAILKWEDVLEGKHHGNMADACALCRVYSCSGYNATCPLIKYAGEEGCSMFWNSRMTYEAKQCMLQLLYVAKQMMIEDGVY